jgi:selenium metabolism protein YedF
MGGEMRNIIVIHSDVMGRGNDDLGKKLIGSFFRKLTLQEDCPEAIIFYNAGVFLLAEGSPVLTDLKVLEEKGVDLIACGTCVSFFELQNKIMAGRVSDMQEITTQLVKAEKIITL